MTDPFASAPDYIGSDDLAALGLLDKDGNIDPSRLPRYEDIHASPEAFIRANIAHTHESLMTAVEVQFAGLLIKGAEFVDAGFGLEGATAAIINRSLAITACPTHIHIELLPGENVPDVSEVWTV